MAVIKKNTSEIRQNPQIRQTDLQTLDGFLARSRNSCITNEDLIEIIYDSLAEQNVDSFYNNGTVSWRKNPVILVLRHFEENNPAREKYRNNELTFKEFIAEINKANEKAFSEDPLSDTPQRLLQNIACSSLCFVNDVYKGKENAR